MSSGCGQARTTSAIFAVHSYWEVNLPECPRVPRREMRELSMLFGVLGK